VLRLLLTMVITILLGLGIGYFMWGSRVVRLTESLNQITLEYDALRSELATRPPRSDSTVPGSGSSDEIRVINEGVAALRQEQSAQRVLLDQLTAAAGTGGGNASSACESDARNLRTELDRCNADKQDLQARASGAARPQPQPQPFGTPPPSPPIQRRPDPRYDNRY